jgi:hypothetical protein
MSEKDKVYQSHETAPNPADCPAGPEEVAEGIPNIDHRFGDGTAEVIGISVLNPAGPKLTSLLPHSTVVVRISVRAKTGIDQPIVGFMLRNHLGIDFAGTNTARERHDLPRMMPGDVCTVDFYLELPALYASTFSFSPAIANGTLDQYSVCDWIDNAVVMQMEKSDVPIYGQFHLQCRVQVNAKLGAGVIAS